MSKKPELQATIASFFFSFIEKTLRTGAQYANFFLPVTYFVRRSLYICR